MDETPKKKTAGAAQQVGTGSVSEDQIEKAQETLTKYKDGKKAVDSRIIENEKWFRLRHWTAMEASSNKVQPASGWLFNALANKHASAMDNYPSPVVLPREAADEQEAKMLTSIIPVILEQDDFEATYNLEQWYKLKQGTGVYGVYWEQELRNGLGDLSIVKEDILNLFWEPGITDIQDSGNVFRLALMDNDALVAQYPQLEGDTGMGNYKPEEYAYDDQIDTTNKSVVVDWYYKVKGEDGRTLLHYCKFVNSTVLFASEGNSEYPNGWYEDGKYPFVFDTLYPIESQLTGFGFIDVGKPTQEYIDRGNQSLMQNLLANAKPRYFINAGGGVNEQEFGDLTRDFVHVDGSLGQDSVLPIQTKPLSDVYVTLFRDKIDELKEVCGNRDVSTGGTTGGATAASALAAMQEAGAKLDRDSNKGSYRAFRQVVYMVIERIRQFWTEDRYYRILGEDGQQTFVSYSNAGIQPQSQGMVAGEDMGYRLPQFDIQVVAEKSNPYSRMSQNELALQFFGAGFFNPQIADQALACLQMMDFDGKDKVIRLVQQNGGMMQQIQRMQGQNMQMAQFIDASTGSNLSGGMAPPQQGQPMPRGTPEMETGGGESGVTRKARARVAASTSP